MDQPFQFELLHVDKHTGARRGRFHTPHGVIETVAHWIFAAAFGIFSCGI